MIVYDSTRKLINLGQELYRGGEGAIHPLPGQAHLVAKIYAPAPPKGYDDKLAWMKANPPADPSHTPGHASIAWPIDLLYTSTGKFAGYTMPYIRNTVPLLVVFNPRSRARTLPGFDWRYLHRAARNLASAITALHACGYVVGDINESNILITPTALVTMIDTDSFQVQEHGAARIITYPCPVGKPEYTPPELQGKTFKGLLRQPEHDCFGLGVLIFQLLMEGSHPFRAQWLGSGDPPSIEERIAKGWFPYVKAPQGPIAPPPNMPALQTLHPSVAALVQRCFVDGYDNSRLRPAPDEWEQALAEAEQALVKCANGHYFSGHLRTCPRCGARVAGSLLARAPFSVPSVVPSAPPPQAAVPASALAAAGVSAQPAPRLAPAERLQAAWQTIRTRTAQAVRPLRLPPALVGLAQRVRTRLAQSAVPLWAMWVLATLVGWVVGFAAGDLVRMLIGETPGRVVTGTVIGLAQWLVLRRRIVESGWWWLATAVSFSAGLSVDHTLGTTSFLPATYFLTGAAQAIVLWRRVRQAPWWMLATVAGGAVGIGVAGGVTHSFIGSLIVGFINGALTGIALVWLLQIPPLIAAGRTQRMAWRAVVAGAGLLMLFIAGVSIGLRPCGWLDTALKLSRCVRALDQPGPSASIAFSPDGTILAAQSLDQAIRLWRVSDGALVHTLSERTTGAAGAGANITFSADGANLIALADDTVLVWRLSDGVLVRTQRLTTTQVPSREHITSAQFSPNGTVLALGVCEQAAPPLLCKSAEIRLWRTADGEFIGALKELVDPVRSMAFSPDGTLLASGSCGKFDRGEQSDHCVEGQISVWWLHDAQLRYQFDGHTGWVSSLTFSNDGSRIASGSADNTVRVWSIDGKLMHVLQHEGPVAAVTFSADNSMVLAASSPLGAWMLPEGVPARTISLPESVLQLAVSPDGSLLAADTPDNKMILWQLR